MTRLFFPILVILGFIFSCNKSCQKTPSIEPISISLATPIETLDPRLATSFSASRAANIVYGTLFVVGDDLNPKPWLAEKYEQLDETTYKIYLRKNLTFHDNSPLTDKDVVYTFSELSSQDVLSPHAEKFNYLESITSLDDRTVIFKLKEPFAPFLTDLCGIGIVSEKKCRNRSKECQHEFVGSGPYKVKQWDRAKETLWLIPFAEFALGAPKDPLVIRIVRDENTRTLELIKGKTDIVDGDISIQKIEELKNQKNLTIKEVPGLGFTYLGINLRKPLLSSKQVRVAMAMAIDFDQIIHKVLLDKAKRSTGIIPHGHWAKDETLKVPPFNPALAKKILHEAGFIKDSNNLWFSLTITSTQNRLTQSVATLFADYLKKVDIGAHVRVKDWSALYEDMQNGNFELFIASWVPVTEPNLYEWVHHSKNIPSENKNGGNRHGYKNPQVDKLIELGKITFDRTKRKEIYQKIEKILLEDLPYIPLWNENRMVVISNSIKGYEPKRTGSLLGIIHAYKETN